MYITGLNYEINSTLVFIYVKYTCAVHLSTNEGKKSVISNTGSFFCFNSTVSNLYNTDAIIYKKKKKKIRKKEKIKVIRTVLFVNDYLSYQNIGHILTLQRKKLQNRVLVLNFTLKHVYHECSVEKRLDFQ